MPICTVDVVLFDRDSTHVLLFLRKNQPAQGEWYTPGGRLLKNESLTDCALRQMQLEAGLSLDSHRLFFGTVVNEIFDDSESNQDNTYHTVAICWGCLLAGDEHITLDAQHDRCEWKAVDDHTLHPFVRRRIAALLPLARRFAGQC